MNRALSISTLALLSTFTVACGDDGGTPPNCLGGSHGAIATCGPWAQDVPEGGEFRIELQKGPDGAVTAATHGYFFDSQTPARRPLEGDEIGGIEGCTDVRTGEHFDNGSPPGAVAIANSRTYIDLGPTASIKSTAQTFTLDKQVDTMDLSSYLVHDIVYLPASNDGTDVMRNHAFDVEWDETSPLGAKTMTEPTMVQGISTPTSQLFVPADMTNISPSFTEVLTPPATGDWVLTYDVVDPPASSPQLLHFIVFYNTETAGVDYQCVGDATGTMTVPRAMLDAIQPSGYVYFGTFTHVGHFQNERRLDLVGVNCQYNEYNK